jgi:hypothetical protein
VLHKSKVTTTAPKAGDTDLDAAEDIDYNDNNHDDTATVTVKITAQQCFAETEICIFLKAICSYLV